MHHNICCCSSFVQCLWAAVQKNNISCRTLKHGVSAQDWCFSPMAALNKLVKKPNRAATGIWRATETALWSRESTWIQREKCDDAGPGRCSITVCFQPAAKEGSFCLVTGVDYQAWLGASFLRNSACLLGYSGAGFSSCGLAGRYCSAQGLCQALWLQSWHLSESQRRL